MDPHPQWTQFFNFHIHFWWKVPPLEVHALPNGSTPPYGKFWICHWSVIDSQCCGLRICGSRRHALHMPTPRTKFFHFACIFTKKGLCQRPTPRLPGHHPLWEILDPPLLRVSLMYVFLINNSVVSGGTISRIFPFSTRWPRTCQGKILFPEWL